MRKVKEDGLPDYVYTPEFLTHAYKAIGKRAYAKLYAKHGSEWHKKGSEAMRSKYSIEQRREWARKGGLAGKGGKKPRQSS